MMKKFFTAALLAVAVTASAQDISFQNTEGLFTNAISLSELESMDHSLDENGQPLVNVTLKNGAIYSNPVDQIMFSNGDPEDILKTDRFANMIKRRHFNHISELELGDFVGVFNEEDYTVEEFMAKSYALISSMSSAIMDIINNETQLKISALARLNGTTSDAIRIHIADIVYVGEDATGKKVPLSARLIYPYCEENNDLNLYRVYIENHVTLFAKNSEPTSAFSSFTSSGVCTNGWLVIQPDLLGWGTTRQYTQIYIDKDLNGSAIAYSVVAAKQFVDWAGSRPKYGVKLARTATIINAGSSQGASSALSGTYYLENKLNRGRYNIPELAETRLCAGAYNMHLCMDKFCELDDMVYACKMPMLVAGAFASHAEDFAPYKIHDYFNPQMKDYVYYKVDKKTGESIPCGSPWQILDLKLQSSLVVEAALNKVFPSEKNSTTPSLKKMMASDLMKTVGGQNVLNWDNPKLAKFDAFLQKNNFASKDIWTPKSRIQMLHAINDDIIPYETSEEFFNNQNYRSGLLNTNLINFTTLDAVPEIMGTSNYAVHLVTCFIWMISEVTGLPASVINDQIKQMIAGMQTDTNK